MFLLIVCSIRYLFTINKQQQFIFLQQIILTQIVEVEVQSTPVLITMEACKAHEPLCAVGVSGKRDKGESPKER